MSTDLMNFWIALTALLPVILAVLFLVLVAFILDGLNGGA